MIQETVGRNSCRCLVDFLGAQMGFIEHLDNDPVRIGTVKRGAAVAVLTILIAAALLTWKKHGEWQRPVQAIVAAVIAATIITAFSPVEARRFEVPAGFESFLRCISESWF